MPGRLGKARIERAVRIFRKIGSVKTNVDAVSATPAIRLNSGNMAIVEQRRYGNLDGDRQTVPVGANMPAGGYDCPELKEGWGEEDWG